MPRTSSTCYTASTSWPASASPASGPKPIPTWSDASPPTATWSSITRSTTSRSRASRTSAEDSAPCAGAPSSTTPTRCSRPLDRPLDPALLSPAVRRRRQPRGHRRGAGRLHHKVGWTIDSLGWRGSSAVDIVERSLRLAAPGAIYVLHVGHSSQDGPALGRIVKGLRERRLRLCHRRRPARGSTTLVEKHRNGQPYRLGLALW